MKTLRLIRVEESHSGTFGALLVDAEVFCWTLELADLLNKQERSSIPAQQYLCKPFQSPHFGKVFKVMNVPGRTDVLIHPGNTADDTTGCILLGSEIGKLSGNRAVRNSGKTFQNFKERLCGESVVHLTIKECY